MKRTTQTPSANAQALYEILAPYCTDDNFSYRSAHGASLPHPVATAIIEELTTAGFTWDTLFQIDQAIYRYLSYEQAGAIHPILRRLRNHFAHLIPRP
jgi:hypothetical protein